LIRVWTLGRICEDLSLEVIAVDLGGGRRLWRHDAVDPKTIQYVDIIRAHTQLGCGLLAVVLRMTVCVTLPSYVVCSLVCLLSSPCD